MRTIDKLDFMVNLFAIKTLPWWNTERVSIWLAPVRWFWWDTVAIQLDYIEPLVEKIFPYSQHHWEWVFKDSEWCCNISIEWADTTNEWDDLEFQAEFIDILQYTWELNNEWERIYN